MKLFYNGQMYTMNDNRDIADAMVVSNGDIVFVGEKKLAEEKFPELLEKIDLEGHPILPGFIDNHVHLLSYGHSLNIANLNGCSSVEEVLERLHQFKANRTDLNEWIEGRGWDETIFSEKRLLNRHDLDNVSSTLKIVIGRSCSFICVVNSLALEEIGLFESIPDRYVDLIQVDDEGVPTGVFFGEACHYVYSFIPKMSKEEIKKCIVDASNDYLTCGITTVDTDDFELVRAGDFSAILAAYHELDSTSKLPIRINLMLYLPNEQLLDEFLELNKKTGDGSDFFRYGHFKLMTDGSLGSREAALKKPYADDPNNCGLTFYTQEELNSLVRKAHENGLSVVCDGIGDYGIQMALNAYRPIIEKSTDKTALRFCIDHCQITSHKIIEEFAELGVIGGLELVFVSSDIPITEERIGYERAQESYNWKTFVNQGVHYCAGSDSPVEHFNPFYGIHAAVNRVSWDGLPPEGWLKEQKLSVDEAISAFTRNGGFPIYREDDLGTLEIGKKADFIILTEDPFLILPEKLNMITVKKTYIGGNLAYCSESSD